MNTKATRPEPTATDWARLAAYIDGEGCISLYEGSTKHKGKTYPHFSIRVSIYNTDPRLAVWCKENFGGFVRVRKHQRAHWRHCFGWVASSSQSARVIRECMPYFLLKREQAQVAELFWGTLGKRGTPTSSEVLALRREYKVQMSQLKWEKRDVLPAPAIVQ